MKSVKKKITAMLLAILLIFSGSMIAVDVMQPVTVAAASAVKLNKTSLTMTKGKTYQLKLRPTQKKVKWSSSRKTVVSVSKSGKIWPKTGGISGFCRGGRHNFSLQFCQGLCILTSLVVNCGGNIHICGEEAHGFPPGDYFFRKEAAL